MTADIPPSSKPASPRSPEAQVWLRMLLTFAAGFIMPVLACYGLILTTSLALRMLPADPGRSSFDFAGSGRGSGPAVAIIRVEGVIVSTAGDVFGGVSLAAAETIVGNIEKAAADPAVKAIILAVNSPGGGVVASDVIYHALKAADKPVVVIMGDLAASGGYYVSLAADWIVANPHTLTGSIGVISEFPNADGLLDKVGVDFVVITSGPRKDFGSPYREMTAEEQAYWQVIVDETHASFVRLVAEGRNMSEEAVAPLADGRVYTGQQALELGLVDALGYETDAVAKAAELGGIEGEPRIVEYPSRPRLLDLLVETAAPRSLVPSLAEIMHLLGHPTLSVRWIGP